MSELDKLVINFNQDELILLNICLGFLMFGIALDLSIKDFKYLFRKPKSVAIGLTSQLLLLPLFTLLLIQIVKPPFSIQLGMLLVASCPGGNISNFMVHRSYGNTPLSITLTSIVTLGAVLTTPLMFILWTKILNAPSEFNQLIQIDFYEMVLVIIQLVVVPLTIGMWINMKLPKIKKAIIRPIQWFSILLLLGIIAFALAGNTEIIKNHLHHVFLLVLFHNGLAYVIGYYFTKANKLTESDARAIAIETGIQNSGLGLIIILNFFSGLGGMMLVAAWWGIWDIISGFALSSFWRGRKPELTLSTSL